MNDSNMSGKTTDNVKGHVWFVYDGECPLCNMAARALEIRKSVGELHLVDARADRLDPLLLEINEKGFDLDEGMVLKYGERLYHGKDVLQMMVLLGSRHGWFNRMNAFLFRYPLLARLGYPVMRVMRNVLLRVRNVGQIRNLALSPQVPLFQQALGKEVWQEMPPVMQQHYAVRPFSDDKVCVEGKLDVTVSPLVGLLARLTGMLLARSGKDVPVKVEFTSDRTGAFRFDRTFHFTDRDKNGAKVGKDIIFKSSMVHVRDNVFVEFMRFGIGWRLAFGWDGDKMVLRHRGYVWKILGFMLPVPLSFIIGKGHAEEVPVSDDGFSMWTHTNHFLFGKTFGYSGEFRVMEVSCDLS